MTYRIVVQSREDGSIKREITTNTAAGLLEAMAHAHRWYYAEDVRVRLYEITEKEIYWRMIEEDPSPAEIRHDL